MYTCEHAAKAKPSFIQPYWVRCLVVAKLSLLKLQMAATPGTAADKFGGARLKFEAILTLHASVSNFRRVVLKSISHDNA